MNLPRVLESVFAYKLLHLVFQMEFELFQTMFFQFFSSRERVFRFQRFHLPIILMMLFHELTVLLIRLHQVRFDIFLCVLFHLRRLSLVELPRPRGTGTCGRPGR